MCSSDLAAVRFLSRDQKTMRTAFERVRRAGPRGAAADVALSLEAHGALLDAYAKQIGALVPARVGARIPSLARELRELPVTRTRNADIRKQHTVTRDALVAELAGRVRDVRAVAALIFRDEPAILEEFAASVPRPRARRSRAPQAPPA